jgi:hypothetical protein
MDVRNQVPFVFSVKVAYGANGKLSSGYGLVYGLSVVKLGHEFGIHCAEMMILVDGEDL